MAMKPFIRRSFGVALAGMAFAGCATARVDERRLHWEPIFTSQAQEPTGRANTGEEIQTLGELLQFAELRNPGLHAAFDRWTAALEQVPQSRALPDPRISYAEFLESVQTRVGPQERRLGVSQMFPLFGKLGLRGEVASHAADAAGGRFEQERLDLHLRIVRLWNDYFYLGRSIAVTEENVRLVENLEHAALAQYSTGKASHSAVVRAQVELGRLEVRLRSLRDQRGPFLAMLNAEVDRPSDAPIGWPTAPAETRSGFDAQLERSPQLAAMLAVADREDAAARLAGKNGIPDLTLGFEYIVTGEAVMPNVLDSGQDASMATASINIPLWFSRNGAERSQARARHSAAQRDLAQLHNRLRANLERARFEVRDADRRVELYELTLLPKARESFAVTRDAFTSGDAGFLDLIDTQRTLLEFQLAHQRALADQATRRAELAVLVGLEPLAEPIRRSHP